jgi:hypothetical protein
MVKFNDKVHIYEGGVLSTKTWDGLSYDNKMFQDITLFYIASNFTEGNLLLNKLNLFQKYTLKHNIDNLIQRIVDANKNDKKSLTLLSGGGGKNTSIYVKKETYEILINVKKGIDDFLEQQKINSSILFV